MTRTAAAILLALILTACANSRGEAGPRVDVLYSPTYGYTCFAIRDEAGKVVGGNCVKD